MEEPCWTSNFAVQYGMSSNLAIFIEVRFQTSNLPHGPRD